MPYEASLNATQRNKGSSESTCSKGVRKEASRYKGVGNVIDIGTKICKDY